MIDLLIINPGNRSRVYQLLGNNISAIEQPTYALLVATYIQKKGYTVKVIDIPASSYTDAELINLVEDYNPKLIALYVYGYQPSASTQNMESANEIITLIKNNNPNRKIMLSGTHPAALPQQTLLDVNVDYVCDREGVKTATQLIDYITTNVNINNIEDLWYKLNNAPTFTKRGAILTVQELNEFMDRPAWELVDMSMYRSHNWHAFGHLTRQPYASIYTSLGCPFKCSFCCINAPFGDMLSGPRPYRLWSPQVIIKQIDELVNKYGVYNIKIVDEMFVLNTQHVIELCDLIIDRGYKLNIWAYARVDSTKPKFLAKLKHAGINWLALGIESASEYVRDGADKRFSDEDIVKVCNNIKENGIYIVGNYIFGLPDDTMESMKNTFDLALYIKAEYSNFYSAMAYPGSPLYYEAIQNKWQLPNKWIGYSQHSYECHPLQTKFISNVDVLKFRDKAFVEFYSNVDYQNHILKTFGQDTVNSINDMLKYSLKRKLLGD
jgi:radical SAM superfamily enzyme YgiQ (UPF0313 family)